MKVSQLDHIVLSVNNIQNSIDFYTRVLGMQLVTFNDNRYALHFGTQKINLHPVESPYKPHAGMPTSGSADLCFIIDTEIDKAIQQLNTMNIHIESGPLKRTGASAELISIYIRDPDNNLIELSNLSA